MATSVPPASAISGDRADVIRVRAPARKYNRDPMDDTTPVAAALDKLGIPHRVFVHRDRVRSLEQAARERGQRPEQVVRSLVFRLSGDEYVMVLMAGPRRVSWRTLRAYLGRSRLTTATEAELLAVTGYVHGAAAPLGLPQPMRILVDESVIAQREISLGSGVRGTAIIMKAADLLRALPASERGSFVDDP